MRNNKKGFTLVELLAVIVILALIMGIAVVSIGGVLNSTRQSTFKETAVSIINGVRQQLTIANKLDEGDYYFDAALLEKGGKESPLGGELKFGDTQVSSCAATNKIGSSICKASGSLTCGANQPSFVRVALRSGSTTVYEYSICLTAGAGNKYIDVGAGTETNLLDSNNTSMIVSAPATTG